MTTWTADQIAVLVTEKAAGKTWDQLAVLTGMSWRQCKKKLYNMNWTKREAENEQIGREKAWEGDIAFKRAMLDAISKGLENPWIGVIKSKSQRYVPVMRGENIAPVGQSVAAECADMGAGRTWT